MPNLTCIEHIQVSNHYYFFLFTETPDKEILWASENGKCSMVEKLILANPAIIHVKDKDGYTPLHRACYNNHEHVVDVSICLDYCWNDFRIRLALQT
jgi:ankyrin repeat protein